MEVGDIEDLAAFFDDLKHELQIPQPHIDPSRPQSQEESEGEDLPAPPLSTYLPGQAKI